MSECHKLLCTIAAVAIISLAGAAAHAQLVGNGDGLMNVNYINTSGANPGNNTSNWLGLWDALDGGGGPTGFITTGPPTIKSYNVQNAVTDTELDIIYNGNFDGFTGSKAYNTIAGDGPGGGPGPFNGGDDFSVRARATLTFNTGGTYSISAGSDDGRRIELAPDTLVGGSPFNGFTAAGNQLTGFTANDTVVQYEPPTGHNHTTGVFNVAAGDKLTMDASFYERGGGDNFHVSLKDSGDTGHGGTGDGWALLTDGVFGGKVSVAGADTATAGQFDVQMFNVVGGGGSNDNDLNNMSETNALWNHFDTNGFSIGLANIPTVTGFDVANNNQDTEVSFDYPGGGNYGVNRPLNSINSNGPSPPNPNGGVSTSNNDYSIRAQTFLEFLSGGTYTIALGSDDGRRIELTAADATGYTGFLSRGDQVNGSFTAGDTVIGFSGGTGHNQSVGVFTVDAGDILELDAFYYQGGGGHSGEISLAQGSFSSWTNTTDFQLLTDGMFGGSVLLHSQVAPGVIPEPSTVLIWSLLAGLGLAAGRRRRKR